MLRDIPPLVGHEDSAEHRDTAVRGRADVGQADREIGG
jgi:hypothetical protein